MSNSLYSSAYSKPSGPFYSCLHADLIRSLETTPRGLSSAEAARRIGRYGRNLAVQPLRRHLASKIIRKLTEPLVAILLAAAIVSGLVGDWTSFLIVLTVIILSIALETLQEHRAEAAVEALKQSVAVFASVVRDGELRRIPVEDIVPGDVVALRAGDLVPADGVVLESREVLVNEALLTGEPYPVEKHAGISGAKEMPETANALFAGTVLLSGETKLWVVDTGPNTRFGHIAVALNARTPPTAFEQGIRHLGVLILRLTMFLVLFVLLVQLIYHRPALESFMFAVALAVGLTPELLPMIMTITLSRGAVRMAARQVVVKRLSAIHDLGAMDILCTDKTGTLTQAKVELADSIDPDGHSSEAVARLAAINSHCASGIMTALDDAILRHTAAATSAECWTKIADLPFDFERRRVSVLVERDGERKLIVKGAPEQIMACCRLVEAPGGPNNPLSGAKRADFEALHRQKAAEGYRLLAIAWKHMPLTCAEIRLEDETELIFAGFCLFLDPPKDSAAAAVSRLVASGIRVKIISGDADVVLKHLVQTLGLSVRGMLTGPEIDTLTDKQLAWRIQSVDLFARTNPNQKRRIVDALKSRGHVVGYLGDGINDGPAIRAADVGLSVQGASDVAREAADMILLAQDLGVVADGVAEGRRTFANIMKYVRVGASSNFGNMLSMALASLLLPFIPLSPVQVLVNNLIYDLSETGIPFDHAEPGELASPHTWNMREVLRFTLVMGPLSSVFDFATFAVLRLWFVADVATFRTAWFIESLITQILVIFVIRTMQPAWRGRIHPALAATSLGALVLALILVASPAGGTLGFVPISAGIWLTICGLSATYLFCAEFVKRFAGSRAGHAEKSARNRP